MSDNLMSRRKFLVERRNACAAAAASPASAWLKVARRTPAPWHAACRGRIRPTPPSSPIRRPSLAARTRSTTPSRAARKPPGGRFVEFLPRTPPTRPRGPRSRATSSASAAAASPAGAPCAARCNGSAAIIAWSSAAAPTHKITDEIMQYYAETPLPDQRHRQGRARRGWTPTPIAPAPTIARRFRTCRPPPRTPSCATPRSSQWTMTTGEADGSVDQKDRCAKACFDMVLKTTAAAERLLRLDNAHASPPARSTRASPPAAVPGCHSAGQGQDGVRFVPRRDGRAARTTTDPRAN